MTNPMNQYGWYEHYEPGDLPQAAFVCAEALEREFPGMTATWIHVGATDVRPASIGWKLTTDVLPTSMKDT